MQNVDDEIRTITEAFAHDLGVLVRKAALEAAAASLGSGVAAAALTSPAAQRGRGRPGRAAATVATPRTKAPARRTTARGTKAAPAARMAGSRRAPQRAPGEKRPPVELVKLTDKLGDYIKSHPGQRMETIGKALAVTTRELNLPVKKLLAARRIRTEGHKRATEYFPA
jgi:hypothetical protein